MKQFVIGGLDTPEKKSEAEAILKGLGYEDRVEWNCIKRERVMSTLIAVYPSGVYSYRNHTCGKTPITLEDLRTMKKQEK